MLPLCWLVVMMVLNKYKEKEMNNEENNEDHQKYYLFLKKIRLGKNWFSATFIALPSRHLLILRSGVFIVNLN